MGSQAFSDALGKVLAAGKSAGIPVGIFGLNPENAPEDNNLGEVNIKKVYKTYQERLLTLNVVDYGDLLLHNINLFRTNSNIYKIYSKKLEINYTNKYF